MSIRRDGDLLYEAISVVQRFVCALEDGRLLRPSLAASLPRLEHDRDRLFLEGVLFRLARRLDRKGEIAELSERLGVVRAIERLARDRLRERSRRPGRSVLLGSAILRQVAADCGLSPATMRKRVRKSTGVAPRTLRQRERICHAIDQIRAGSKVSSAAHECGYRSESSFFAAFRRATGLSPAAVRSLSLREASALKTRLMPWAPPDDAAAR